MAKRAPSLTVEQLKQVFGVSHVTIFHWSISLLFPAVGYRTPGEITRWAKRHKKPMVRNPLDVVLGRSSKKADALQRSATGRLTSINPSRAGSLGTWAAKKNSIRSKKSAP